MIHLSKLRWTLTIASIALGCNARGDGTGATSSTSGPCAAGQTLCGDHCVDLSADSSNCGSCGQVCPTGTSCNSGVCSCAAGLLQCSSVCVDQTQDPRNCGNCGTSCQTGQLCQLGQCQCQMGLTPCNGACVDTQSSGDNCGACGNVCPAGLMCSSGTCGSSCTGATETQCGNSCVVLNSDVRNCGACNQACAAGQSCSGGTCTCPSGQMSCNGQCVTVASDANNCGACAVKCATGQTCQDGQCTCSTGQTLCGSACADQQIDSLNCGGCGITCGSGMTCSAGTCTGGATGASSTGGTSGSGGAPATGGTLGSGGAPATGGALSTGGSSAGTVVGCTGSLTGQDDSVYSARKPSSSNRYLPFSVGVHWGWQETNVSTGASGMRQAWVASLDQLTGTKAGVAAFRVQATTLTGSMVNWQEDTGTAIVRHRTQDFDTAGTLTTSHELVPSKLHLDDASAHVVAGASWTETYTDTKTTQSTGVVATATVTVTWTVEAVDESVTVPAGTFSCLRVHRVEAASAVDSNGADNVYWYARGVGKVKETGTINHELLGYCYP
jgi:hypothetical protein